MCPEYWFNDIVPFNSKFALVDPAGNVLWNDSITFPFPLAYYSSVYINDYSISPGDGIFLSGNYKRGTMYYPFVAHFSISGNQENLWADTTLQGFYINQVQGRADGSCSFLMENGSGFPYLGALNSSGQTMWASQDIHHPIHRNYFSPPQILLNPNDSYTAIWNYSRSNGNAPGIVVYNYDQNGILIKGDSMFFPTGKNMISSGLNANGNIWLAGESMIDSVNSGDIWTTVLDSDLVVLKTEIFSDTAASGDILNAFMGFDEKGNILLCGTVQGGDKLKGKLFVTKTTPNGIPIFTTNLNFSLSSYSVFSLPGGKTCVPGISLLGPTSTPDSFRIAVLDSNGIVLWQKGFKGYVPMLTVNDAGEIFLTIRTYYPSIITDFYCFFPDGQKKWVKHIYHLIPEGNLFRSLYPDAFGNLYSFEKNEYNHTDSTESIRLVKMNSQGDVTNTLFQTYFGPWYGLNIANVIPDKEGNVLFGFTTYINNVRKFVLQKYDKDFQQIFYREFIPDNYLWASQVDNFVLDDAGNIFLSGMVMDIDPRKIFLCNMLIDANGNLVWEHIYSTFAITQYLGTNCFKDSGGGYYTNCTLESTNRRLLMKYDENGSIMDTLFWEPGYLELGLATNNFYAGCGSDYAIYLLKPTIAGNRIQLATLRRYTQPVSITKDKHHQAITAYPNPFRNSIQFKATRPVMNAQLFIYDLPGRLFHAQKWLEETTLIYTETWPSGMYIWQLKDGDAVIEGGKVIKE